MSRAAVAVAVAALAATTTAGCGGGDRSPATAPAASADRDGSVIARTPPAPSVVTSTAPTRASTPTAAARLDRVPRTGTVGVQPGPFTDKLKVSALRLAGGPRPAVSGNLRQSTDVSEVLSLILRADFYDADGKLVGSRDRSFGGVGEFFDRPFSFTLRAHRALPATASAVLNVLDYVPE